MGIKGVVRMFQVALSQIHMRIQGITHSGWKSVCTHFGLKAVQPKKTIHLAEQGSQLSTDALIGGFVCVMVGLLVF